jgi:hypothetical protein
LLPNSKLRFWSLAFLFLLLFLRLPWFFQRNTTTVPNRNGRQFSPGISIWTCTCKMLPPYLTSISALFNHFQEQKCLIAPHTALLWTSAPLLQVPEARELRSSWFRKQGIKLCRSCRYPFSFWTKITGTAPKNERLRTAVYNPRKSRKLQQASTRALHRVRNKRFLATIDADFQTPKLLFDKRKTDSWNRVSPAWMKIGLGTKSDLRVCVSNPEYEISVREKHTKRWLCNSTAKRERKKPTINKLDGRLCRICRICTTQYPNFYCGATWIRSATVLQMVGDDSGRIEEGGRSGGKNSG